MKTDNLDALLAPLAEMGTGAAVGVIGFYLLTVVLLLLWRPIVTLAGIAVVFLLNGLDVVQSLAWLAMILPLTIPVSLIGLARKKGRLGHVFPKLPSRRSRGQQVEQAGPQSCGICYVDESGAFQAQDHCPQHGNRQYRR